MNTLTSMLPILDVKIIHFRNTGYGKTLVKAVVFLKIH